MGRHAAGRLNERGDLSAYLAAAMLLPLLLLIAGGGAATQGLLSDRETVLAISYEGLRAAEVSGGLTQSGSAALRSQLQLDIPRLSQVSISGTPPGTSWGDPVCITVLATEPLSLLFLRSFSVQMGGKFCGVSDLPPTP